MKKSTLAFGLLFFAGLSGLSAAPKNSKASKNWKLIWSDEFSGKELDTTKWDYQLGTGSQYGLTGWGNNEQEYYKKENVYLEKGNLVLEAKKETYEGMPYTSGRIRTFKEDGTILFATTYGRIEARIKMPTGDGIWPAFWMLPATDKYGWWAANGELDIMEAKGRLVNRVYGTVHFGQVAPGNKYTGDMYKFPNDEDISDFHIYSLEWEPGSLKWYVDDNLFYETHNWWSQGPEADEPFPYPAPFDVPFYIIFDLAVGGNFDDGRNPSDYELPAKMLVDYVRVYEKKDGYNYDVKKPVPPQDTKTFEKARVSEDGNFIMDTGFSTATTDALGVNTMDRNSGNWYFLALNEFGGTGTAKVEDGAFHIKNNRPGNEVHSVQLLQHLGIAKGYTYQISFEAKASADRNITVKLGGDDDNKWAIYSQQYTPKLTEEYKTFKYRFTMEEPSDLSARLEFNVGIGEPDVWIRNVKVIRLAE